MKKVVVLLMAFVMVFGLIGCTRADNTSDTSTTGTDESWTKVEEAGELVLGLDDAFPPMGYKDTQTGELIGFDIDLATEVCERLGIELTLQPVDWNNKSSELNNGNVDCLWNGFSKTDERDKEFNLSIPYMKNNQVILVKTDSEYNGLDDLAGKTLGVQTDSSAEVALNSDDAKDFKDSLGEIVAIDDYTKAILEIQNGTIDAIAIDEIVARFYLTDDPDAYRILEDGEGNVASLAVEDYVVGFRKDDEALKVKIEDTLKEMKEDGTLKTISEKWFQEDVTTIE
ncbi:MAG: amino acid ABC transporter substrate-binding protein [Lachnospiraceae bacterium]